MTSDALLRPGATAYDGVVQICWHLSKAVSVCYSCAAGGFPAYNCFAEWIDEGCRQRATLLEILHIVPCDVYAQIVVVHGHLQQQQHV